MEAYYTYILECFDGSFYIGITIDLPNRLLQHNGIRQGGAKYTRSKRPVVLRYYETYANRTEAARREYQLKKLSHKKRSTLCDSFTCRL